MTQLTLHVTGRLMRHQEQACEGVAKVVGISWTKMDDPANLSHEVLDLALAVRPVARL